MGFQSLQWRPQALPPSFVSWPTDYVFSQPSDPRPAPSQTSSGNKALRLSRPDSAAHLVACSHPFRASQVTTGLHMCSGASPDLEFGSGVRFHSKSISKIKQNKNSCASKDLRKQKDHLQNGRQYLKIIGDKSFMLKVIRRTQKQKDNPTKKMAKGLK